jgi:hypothetical protein
MCTLRHLAIRLEATFQTLRIKNGNLQSEAVVTDHESMTEVDVEGPSKKMAPQQNGLNFD